MAAVCESDAATATAAAATILGDTVTVGGVMHAEETALQTGIALAAAVKCNGVRRATCC